MENIYFKWDNDLMTGFGTIDEQHKGLVELINILLQVCFSNEEITVGVISDIYDELANYVVDHFKTEEQLMEEYKVDTRHKETHYSVHEDFKENVKELFKDYSVLTNPDKLNEVTEFLIRWLAYHILNMDKALVNQINHINHDELTPQNAYEREVQNTEVSTEPLLKALKALFMLVSEKNKALKKANSELEEKVRQRTMQLIVANEQLEQLSTHDELTGLPNRRYAIDQIEKLINNYSRYNATFSLLFIDVDKFKGVNDKFGHEYGDIVLKWIASFLRENLRKSDVPCRLGGDEFLVICSHCDGESAFSLGSKLSILCQNYNRDVLKKSWEPSLSIGIAEIDESCKTVNDILKKADGAMYIAKNNGGGHAVLV